MDLAKAEPAAVDLTVDRLEAKHVLLAGEAERVLFRLRRNPACRGFRKERGWITTVYLDRPDGSLARATLRRPAESFKVRLREYFTADGEPCSDGVWLEVKERSGLASRKSRFQIRKRQVARFLKGELDPAEIPASPAVDRLRRIAAGPLVPMGAVRYRRLALEGGAPRARLTLDREVAYYPGPIRLYDAHPALDAGALGPPSVVERGAIVELKYAGPRTPDWCARAVLGFAPAEYSKFLVLSSLARSDSVARNTDDRELPRGVPLSPGVSFQF
jgi:hypothetical protein